MHSYRDLITHNKFELTFIGHGQVWIDETKGAMTYWYRMDGFIDEQNSHISVEKREGRLRDVLNETYLEESTHRIIQRTRIEIENGIKPRDLSQLMIDEIIRVKCVEDCKFYINSSFHMNSPGNSIPRWSITLGAPSHKGGDDQRVFLHTWLEKYCALYM
jgi:hypothetical protein